jgi:hypothetical protein
MSGKPLQSYQAVGVLVRHLFSSMLRSPLAYKRHGRMERHQVCKPQISQTAPGLTRSQRVPRKVGSSEGASREQMRPAGKSRQQWRQGRIRENREHTWGTRKNCMGHVWLITITRSVLNMDTSYHDCNTKKHKSNNRSTTIQIWARL